MAALGCARVPAAARAPPGWVVSRAAAAPGNACGAAAPPAASTAAARVPSFARLAPGRARCRRGGAAGATRSRPADGEAAAAAAAPAEDAVSDGWYDGQYNPDLDDYDTVREARAPLAPRPQAPESGADSALVVFRCAAPSCSR